MKQRVLSLVAALAVFVFVSAAFADKPASPDKPADNTVIGTVTSTGTGVIIITDKDGKDHSLTVSKDAKISCDGKECKLDDLKKGTSVTVTLKADDKTMATAIDAKTAKENPKEK